MTPRESAAGLFERFGRSVSLITTEERVRCFLQPMRYKNKMFLDSQYTKLGVVDESCFLYLGPPEYDLPEAPYPVLWDENGDGYTCVKRETVYLGTQPIYLWAVMRREDGV